MHRLLCIVSSMNAGGAETFIMKIYRALDKTKYQIDFCVNIKEPGFYDEEIIKLGGKIYHIPPKSVNLKEFERQLYAIISENGYKKVMRITSNAIGFIDLKVAKKAGATMCIARSSNSSEGGSLKAKSAHFIGRLFYSKYVDVKIAPSDLAAIHTFGSRAYYGGKIHILHNAVDLGLFHYDEEFRKNIRREFGISNGDIVFGHIGRFSRQKNHDFLIKVFHSICLRESKCKFILIGSGELEMQIKSEVDELRLNDKVIFAGVRSDIPKLLSAMDVFVFPSLYEGMPNAVIEAQATGLPCLISDSITQEANITGHVKYMSLSQSASDWAQMALNQAKQKRWDTKHVFIQKGYDIQSVVEEFEKMVYCKD